MLVCNQDNPVQMPRWQLTRNKKNNERNNVDYYNTLLIRNLANMQL